MGELATLLSQLTGREFECFLRDLWAARGWDTQLTDETGDDGVDVILERYEFYQQRKLIQTKCIQPDEKLSRSTVQQYSYLLHEDNVDEAILVTTGGFTEGARQSAAKANLKLIDGETLEELVFDTVDTTGDEFDAESYVPEYEFESSVEQSEPASDADSVLTTPDGDADPENIPSTLQSRIDQLSDFDDVYNRLIATIGHNGFGIDTRLLLLFQLFRGDDPFDVLVLTEATAEYRPLLNRIVDLQEPKPTEHINCRRTDVDTVIGIPQARGGYPGLLSELGDGLLAMSEFSENDALHSELVEPLQSGTVRFAKQGRTEATPISVSVLAVGTPKEGAFDNYAIHEQVNIGLKSLKSFDGITENHVNMETDANVIDRLPAIDEYTTADAIEKQVFKAYRMVANNIDPEVPENIHKLLNKIILKVEEIEVDNSLLDAGHVGASLLRGAKASARIELRETVCENDIRRASVVLPPSLIGGKLTEIVENPLAYNPTGSFNTNRVRSGASGEVKEMIIALESEYEEGVPIEDVVEKASEMGLDASQTEQEIDRLRGAGEVSEPKQNLIVVNDKMEWLINDIERDHDDGAPIETVLERAPEIGLTASQAERKIEKLRRKGEVYEPKMDHFRTI